MNARYGVFHIEDAPMEDDRAAGWQFVRDAGEIVLGADGAYYFTSPDAVQFAQRNPDLFSSARAFDGLSSPVPLIPIAIDPPSHTRYRKILDPMLAPRVIGVMDDELRRQAREIIAGFAPSGSCDIVTDLARLYPTQVFLTLFGLPLTDRDQFVYWAETIIENTYSSRPGIEVPDIVLQAATDLFAYLERCVADKRAHPGDDMLSKVLSLTGDEAWTQEEVLGLCFMFILAGLDTVAGMIGFLFLHLARRTDLRAALVAEPDLSQPIVEEVLRLEPAVASTPRVATQDIEVCGTTIPAGSPVMLCLGAVSRDPGTYATPDEIDLGQADLGHRAFGGGIHRCVGSHLARRELRIIAEEFHALIPAYEIAAGVQPKIAWPSGTMHLRSLPLVFAPVAP